VKGQDVSGEYRFTHVWVKRNDHWQVVASQVTRIAKP
jgi:ketosteroid isomerase-like protein